MNKQINKIRWGIGTLLLGSIIAFSFLGIVTASGFSDTEEGEKNEHRGLQRFKSQVKFKQDSLYSEECGACHLAYPPGLLPVESWQKLMAGLDDHFGDNAELDEEAFTHIANYLSQQALQKGQSAKMSKMLRNAPNITPIRITELPYFINKHDEIPDRMVIKNPKVGSFSRCNSCHKDAEKGVFNEDMVSIPGFGHWDD